jgi:hypothetical protein
MISHSHQIFSVLTQLISLHIFTKYYCKHSCYHPVNILVIELAFFHLILQADNHASSSTLLVLILPSVCVCVCVCVLPLPDSIYYPELLKECRATGQ